MSRKAKDLAGQRFGRLVALHDNGTRLNRKVAWMCRCDCGKRKLVRSTHLTGGEVRSCGCAMGALRKEGRVAA